MQKMDLRAILRGGAAAAITFVIVEIVVEGAVSLLGVSGTGLKGALVTSAVLWFMYFLFATNLVNLGIFPLNIAVTSLAFNLVEIPLAVLVGTRIYNRSAESD